MKNYLKGIVVGFGGIVPGLSGSVLLVIFGLYKETINAFGTLNNNLKKNISFLLPICLGMISGVLLFSKFIDFLLIEYELQTRFMFLGLVLGTLPLFYKEVTKEGFSNKYYLYVLIFFLVGRIFIMSSAMNNQIDNLNFFSSVILGVIVAGSSIVPGIDTTVILSSCGLYEVYVSALSGIDLLVLLPMLLGLILGLVLISKLMNVLVKRHYTLTFSIIFGFFISIIPNVLPNYFSLALNMESICSVFLMVVGFFISYFLGKNKKNCSE